MGNQDKTCNIHEPHCVIYMFKGYTECSSLTYIQRGQHVVKSSVSTNKRLGEQGAEAFQGNKAHLVMKSAKTNMETEHN